MRAILFLLMGVAVVSSAFTLLTGCSGNSDVEQHGLIENVIDSVTLTVVEHLTDAMPVSANESVEATAVLPGFDSQERVTDIRIIDKLLYATGEKGLLIFNPETGSQQKIAKAVRLSSILAFGGTIYIGGEELYTLEDAALLPVESTVGSVTCLAKYGGRLIIGTSQGLYVKTEMGTVELFEDIDVASMAIFDDGLWVASKGEGLYRWDGDEFKRRYLRRDSTLFDFVTDIKAGYNHLYVGTGNGLFIYDGGSWRQLGIADGLPAEHITAIDADGWIVYLSTSAGIVSFYKDEFKPVKGLEDQTATVLARLGRKIFIGTEFDGLYIKSGPVVKKIEPINTESPIENSAAL